MVNDYMLDKVLDKIKETIDISKFDATKILTDTFDFTDDKLPDYITLKNAGILITCIFNMYHVSLSTNIFRGSTV